MSLIKYSNSLSNLSNRFNRLFDLAFNKPQGEALDEWSPALDAFEDKDKYVVSVEVPGLKKEDINVVLHDGVLTVSGERKSEKDIKEGIVHRTERYYGKFSRSVTLPTAVKAEGVIAGYKDGVLTVEVPKAEEAKPKSIEVKVA